MKPCAIFDRSTSRHNLFGIARLVLFAILILGFGACSSGGGDSEDNGDGDTGGENTPGKDACGDLGLKIIDGSSCSTDQSAVVSLTMYEFDGSAAACTGTLIDPTHVLTAGHCFSFRTVAVDVQFGGTTVQASNFERHPNYFEDEANLAVFNDVAVVTVQPPAGVSPVPLLLSKAPQVGEVFDIFGYGFDENGQIGTLKSGQMQIDDVTDNHIFSLFDGQGSNTCQGDSGGPAIQVVNGQAAVIGVTSSGSAEAACQVGDLSLFVNIQESSVLDFVTSRAPGTGAI